MRDAVSAVCFLLTAVLGAVALTAGLLAHQVAEPERPGRTLATVLEEPRARGVVADEIADRVLAERPELRRSQVELVTRQVLAQPAVRGVLGSVTADESGNVDSAALADTIASKLRARGQDRLADEVREQSGLLPPISIDSLGQTVQRARVAVWTVSAVAGILAAIFAFFGFASGSTRSGRWAGLGIAVMAAGGLAWLVLSRAAATLGADAHPVAVLVAGLGRSAASSVVWPMVACLVVGAAMLLGGLAAARRG